MGISVLHCEQHRLFADVLGDVLRERGHEVSWISAPDELAEIDGASIDVCLTGTEFTDVGVPDLVTTLRRTVATSRIVVLTPSPDPVLATVALQRGADAVVAKTVPIEVTMQAIEGGRKGMVPRSSPTPQVDGDAAAVVDWTLLTPREHEVLTQLASGHSTGRIAHDLGIAHTTARTYIQNVLTKLGAHSKVQAVAAAYALDLVTSRGGVLHANAPRRPALQGAG